MKTCIKCNIEKEDSEYSKNKNCKDGLLNACKGCCGLYQRKGKLKKEKKIAKDGYKFCAKCKQEKFIENFYKSKDGKIGGYCRPCLRLYAKSHSTYQAKRFKEENPQATDTTTYRGEERKTVVGFNTKEAKALAFKDISDEVKSDLQVTTRKRNKVFAPSQFYQKIIFDNYTVHSNYICTRIDRVQELFAPIEIVYI